MSKATWDSGDIRGFLLTGSLTQEEPEALEPYSRHNFSNNGLHFLQLNDLKLVEAEAGLEVGLVDLNDVPDLVHSIQRYGCFDGPGNKRFNELRQSVDDVR